MRAAVPLFLMKLHLVSRISLLFAAALVCSASLAGLAGAAADTSIQVNQKSDLEALGSWTILEPDRHELKGDSDSQVFHSLPAGRYSLFGTPPSGTTAKIEISKGGEVLQTFDYPQAFFDVVEGDAILLSIHYIITNSGKVGVNSVPSGIPFELHGPNGMVKTGVTPASYDAMPVGNYGVQYMPDGCPTPPQKSAALQRDTSAYFSIDIQCDTLKAPPEASKSDTNLSTDVNGSTVTFTDVTQDAWYTPFVGAVARAGILTGYKDEHGRPAGRFGPNDPVTVGELAKIAHELAGIDVRSVTMAPHNPLAIGKWFTRYVASAEDSGWTLYLNDHENLYRPATRGEVLVTFLQALDIPLQWQKGKIFKDVDRRTPYASAVETAYALGIIEGSTDEKGESTGLFHPDASINRAEMAKLVITIEEKIVKKRPSSSASSL